MQLTGAPFLALTVVGFVAGAAWLPRTRRSARGFIARPDPGGGQRAEPAAGRGGAEQHERLVCELGRPARLGQPECAAGPGRYRCRQGAAGKTQRPGLPAAAAGALPPLPAPGQRVQTFELTGAHSGLAGRVVVSLPRGYQDPANAGWTYPVIEAFHGFPGGPEVWIQGVNLVPSIDALSGQQVISDAIVIAPQIEFPPGTDTECVNGGKGQPQVETWLATDVPDQIASVLRVRRDRASWAATGFSSGGWCAAMAVMLHPDVFGVGIILGGYLPRLQQGLRPLSSQRPHRQALRPARPGEILLPAPGGAVAADQQGRCPVLHGQRGSA